MKILYLLRYWPVFGGGETVTRTLANELCIRGYEVGVVYLWDRTNDNEIYLKDTIKNIKINNINNVKDGTIPKSEYKRLTIGLKEAILSFSPDIIINQWLPSELVWKATKGMEVKVIKCHHSIIKYVPHITTIKQKIFYFLFGSKAGWLRVYPELRRDYIYSDKWIFLSESSKEEAKCLIKTAKENKLGVITNPLPYCVDEKIIDVSKKNKEVVFVGRVVQLKRLGYLLEAWKLIEDKIPDWTFKIIGDGDYLEQEKIKAANLKVKNVKFLGYQDPKQYLIDGSFLLMASNQEGFGMVIIEAQHCGCVPIVVDSYSTVHDIIDDGINGILVENNNVQRYADVLLNAIADDSARQKMALKAIEDSGKYSVVEICNQWEELFKSIKTKRR
ncbi:glycosyltransferase [Selenomonas sp. ND2010]|uniref:glycosyltransferase n=1 Tax=Selenomonas sp. ND2010 TaxID=1410618 RepID=UPI00051B20EC|nr:glycosyltransferase [Selenomonas sp. ND2010]